MNYCKDIESLILEKGEIRKENFASKREQRQVTLILPSVSKVKVAVK